MLYLFDSSLGLLNPFHQVVLEIISQVLEVNEEIFLCLGEAGRKESYCALEHLRGIGSDVIQQLLLHHLSIVISTN